jgi:hypothetical protein
MGKPLNELQEMRDKSEFVTFKCIGNPVRVNTTRNVLGTGNSQEDHRKDSNRYQEKCRWKPTKSYG